MDKLPILDALISDEQDGLLVMSLVGSPATEKDWVCFNSDKQVQRFAVQDSEEHILCGVVMVADTPIYRRDSEGREFYIRYSKETLKVMAEKMLFDNTANNIDLQHNGEILPKGVVALRELFLKDVEKGINPTHFEDVPDGSLLCTYKVNDSDLWELCKNGEFSGFSLEGSFSVVRTDEYFNKTNKNKNYMSKVKELLKKLLVEMGSLSTDKGILDYDGEEVIVGIDVTVNGEVAQDGEYVADGIVYTVAEGKIQDIKPVEEKVEETVEEMVEDEKEEEVTEEPEEEAEEETEEPAVEEEVADEPEADEKDSKISELEARVAELEAMVADKEAEIEALNAKLAEPAVEPIAEEFEAQKRDTKLDKKVNKAIAFAKALNS